MKIFISYAKGDRGAAENFKSLAAEAGCEAWLAPASMQGKQSFQKEIAAEICGADYFVVLCSPAATISDWVERELTHAQANSKQVVPIWIADFPTDGWLRLLIGPLDWIDARKGFTAEVKERVSRRFGSRVKLGRVITTLNLKGGVGKTTLTANMAAESYFASSTSTLLVDLDPQYNLTQFFLGESQIERLRESNRTILSLFERQGASASDISRVRDNCFSLLARSGERAGETPFELLAGHDDLFAYTIDEKTLEERQSAIANFAAFIGSCRAFYDVVQIDVNPSASFLTKCALSVADHVMAPVRPERYALNGLRLLERLMRRVKEREFDANEVSIVINQIADRFGVGNQDVEIRTREAIQKSDVWRRSLAPEIVPFSTTMQPPALDSTGERPLDMVAQRNRAPAQLRAALRSSVEFVHKRAGVIHAGRDGRGPQSAPRV